MKVREKKKSRAVRIIQIVVLTVAVLALAVSVLFILVPYLQDQKAEKLKAEEAAELEEARLEQYDKDLADFTALEYEAVLLTMQGNENWSADQTIKGYLGYDWVRNNESLNAEEFTELMNLALASDNAIECFYMVIDPFKMFKPTEPAGSSGEDEGKSEEQVSRPLYELSIDIASVANDNPDIAFTIYTPFDSRQYWDSVKYEDYPYIAAFYEKVLKSLVKCKNIRIMCFTGESWLTDNPALFEDPLAGDLRSEVYEKLFLYSFIDGVSSIRRLSVMR